MTKHSYKGLFTALITPFKNYKVDQSALVNLIEWQINSGVNGLVICGSTGEAHSMHYGEHYEIIDLSVKTAKDRVPVIAGAGSHSTAEAKELARSAEKAGADAVLVMTPCGNKPSQEGLYQHFKAVAEHIEIPMILYNNPARSVVDLSDEVIVKLAEIKNIIGIKDATGNLERPLQLLSKLGKDFIQFSGEDATALAFNAHGGHGCISIASNIAPDLCASIQKLWFEGNRDEALQQQLKLLPLYEAMTIETNPVPVKYAASLLGICESETRLPLVQPSLANQQFIQSILEKLGMVAF